MGQPIDEPRPPDHFERFLRSGRVKAGKGYWITQMHLCHIYNAWVARGNPRDKLETLDGDFFAAHGLQFEHGDCLWSVRDDGLLRNDLQCDLSWDELEHLRFRTTDFVIGVCDMRHETFQREHRAWRTDIRT